MPFPIAIFAGGAALQPASTVFFFEALAAIGATKVGVEVCQYWFTVQEELPTFVETEKAMTGKVHAKVETLVTASAECLNQEKKQSEKEANRMEEGLVRRDSVITTTERLNDTLQEVAPTILTQKVSNHEAVQVVTDTQAVITSELKEQQSDVKAMAKSLRNLPEFLRARRDKQALLVENKQLKSTIKTLEGKVLELSSCMDEALVFAEEMQTENDALRKQVKVADEGNQNRSTGFGLNIFQS